MSSKRLHLFTILKRKEKKRKEEKRREEKGREEKRGEEKKKEEKWREKKRKGKKNCGEDLGIMGADTSLIKVTADIVTAMYIS